MAASCVPAGGGGTLLAVVVPVLDVETAGADGLATMHAQKALRVVSVLKSVYHLLY